MWHRHIYTQQNTHTAMERKCTATKRCRKEQITNEYNFDFDCDFDVDSVSRLWYFNQIFVPSIRSNWILVEYARLAHTTHTIFPIRWFSCASWHISAHAKSHFQNIYIGDRLRHWNGKPIRQSEETENNDIESPIVCLNHLCAFIFTNWLENCFIVKIENEKKATTTNWERIKKRINVWEWIDGKTGNRNEQRLTKK